MPAVNVNAKGLGVVPSGLNDAGIPGGFMAVVKLGVCSGSGMDGSRLSYLRTICGTSSGGVLTLGTDVICGTDVDEFRAPEVICFRDVELLLSGRSLRAAKLRGLLPRTMMAPEWDSAIAYLPPVESDAMTFR